ncbi:MAG: type II toxin-antitoxin system HicA family toxin [Armatimonadetes bacterium]|nr:type II toxin-antitoxin system HicA family toxin [Armatimonadota bacterium]
MSEWTSVSAKELLRVLIGKGWEIKRTTGSHRVLSHESFPDFVFAFHDREEVGPKMLSRIAKKTGLTPQDLR